MMETRTRLKGEKADLHKNIEEKIEVYVYTRTCKNSSKPAQMLSLKAVSQKEQEFEPVCTCMNMCGHDAAF